MLSSISQFRSFFKSKLGIKPLGARVVIELDKKKDKVNGILVPDAARQEINQGTVLAIGQGRRVDNKVIPISVKVGQRVLLPQYGGQVVKLNNQEYTIIDEEMILGTFDK